jgi:hypothetical protein
MDSIHFHGEITTGTALGGWIDVDVQDSGDYQVHFHMHSKSILGSFDFNLRAYLGAPGFPTMAFVHSGHVSGVDSADHQESGHSEILRVFSRQLKAAPRFEVVKGWSWSGVIGTISDVLEDIAELFAGAAGAALGLVILLRLVTQSAARAQRYSILLEEAYDAAERLKAVHEARVKIVPRV